MKTSMELANNSDEHVRSVVARGRQADKEWLWWIEIIFFEEAALSQAKYTVQYLTKTHPYNSSYKTETCTYDG